MLKQAVDFGDIHVIQILGPRKMQEFWSWEGFCSDFRRNPGRPESVSLRRQSVKLLVKAQRCSAGPRKLKKMETRNMNCLRKAARNEQN